MASRSWTDDAAACGVRASFHGVADTKDGEEGCLLQYLDFFWNLAHSVTVRAGLVG